MAARDPQRDQRSSPPPEPEYEEITLADIVQVLHRRKIVLISIFLVTILAGIAVTAFSEPEYESEATMIPLEHQDIIHNWLASRNSAELVVDRVGDPVTSQLYPDRWNEQQGAWEDEPPTSEQAAARLVQHVTVTEQEDRFLRLTVTFNDPQLTQTVASAYLETLDDLRAHLEDITRQEAFDRYYDGTNEQQAQNRAETTAQQKDYWIMLDRPLTGDQTSPNPTLNIALAATLGIMLGIFSAFLLEWVQNYRTEMRNVDVPSDEQGPDETQPTADASQP